MHLLAAEAVDLLVAFAAAAECRLQRTHAAGSMLNVWLLACGVFCIAALHGVHAVPCTSSVQLAAVQLCFQRGRACQSGYWQLL
jgi:hypothetical protein